METILYQPFDEGRKTKSISLDKSRAFHKVWHKIERCQENLAEGKKIILKQQKLLRIADRGEDGWEVVKCYLSDELAPDSEDEK